MHEEAEIIDKAFVSEYGEEVDRAERLNKRNDLAKQLLNTTYKHTIPELEQRAREANDRDIKEWGLELEEIGQAEDVQL